MYITFRFKGVEADDIAAYIATRCSGGYEHVWLISSDKDWDLLINENISRFSYVIGKEITLINWNDHYDYRPEDHISVKVLQGDSGDHVFGIEGIGPKRAVTLLKEYGTAYDVYAALPIDSKYKYIQNLNASGDKILLNYELMDLETYCVDNIGLDNCDEIDACFNDWPEEERIDTIGSNGNSGDHYVD